MNLSDLLIRHHFAGGAYAKETHIPMGHILVQHKHLHDHLSIMMGTAVVDVDGERSMITGPAVLRIEAGKHHAVQAVTDVLWYCIHATDETDPANVDAVLIEPAAA